MLGAAHSSINKHGAGEADVPVSASSWNRIAGSAWLHPSLQTVMREVKAHPKGACIGWLQVWLAGWQVLSETKKGAAHKARQEERLLDYL